MLANYFKIALRNFKKQKGYSFINIFGLAIGLACFLLIFAYIQFELSYDRFHEDADRIYRVVHRQPSNIYLGTDHFAVMPAPLPRALEETFPEVQHATALDARSALLSVDDQFFYEEGLEATATFFDVFTFPLLEGDPQTALAEPNAIVLTTPLAQKLFGDADPLGRTLTLGNETAYTVTGLIDPVPENAHFTFTFITSLVSSPNFVSKKENDTWSNSAWYTYLKLHEGASRELLQAKLPHLTARHFAGEGETERRQFYLQALTDIHLRSHINMEIAPNNDIVYIYLFAGVAVLILLLACINYTNLAVAQSMKRAKEVGLRKVVGAHRRQLVGQFIGESVLMTCFALLVALVLAYLMMPLFNQLIERPLRLYYLSSPPFLAGMLGLTILVGLISGSYPALFIVRLQPIPALKGGLTRLGSSRLRSMLVGGQYAISIILVAGSLIIYQQLHFIQTKKLGYNREHIVAVNVRDAHVKEQFDVIKANLLRDPHILSVTSSEYRPTDITSQSPIADWDGNEDGHEQSVYLSGVGYDFANLYALDIVQGSNFSADRDTEAYLLNEAAVRALGWDVDAAVGKNINSWMGNGPVVGVVKDFHFHSFHLSIQPLVLYLAPGRMDYISVKVHPADLPGTLNYLTETLQAVSPYPVDYAFLDEVFDRMYKAEVKLGELFGYFTVLALLIAALGLFGLAAYAAEQRTKEVGVRKVLGATVGSIVLLLSKDFVKLVILAAAVGVPIAYIAMQRWLNGFAYRIELGPGVFILTGVLVIGLAFLSVSYQAVKAALADPVKSLRYE